MQRITSFGEDNAGVDCPEIEQIIPVKGEDVNHHEKPETMI